MKPEGKTLVVGATGILGSEILALLHQHGCAAHAVVRESTHAAKKQRVAELAANVVVADLKHPESLASACAGVEIVISTASSTLSRGAGDSIESVDRRGQLALVEAAERAGVRHFVFVSFPETEIRSRLQDAKRSVEKRLIESSMSYAILQPVDFMEVWLSPALGFDLASGRARVFGTGTQPVSWISVHDVARFAVGAASGGAFSGKVVPLGGPDPLSPLQVISMFEELGGRKVEVEHVPEAVLVEQLGSARDEFEEAFAAVMLSTARGQPVDPRASQALLPGRLKTVREYLTGILNASKE